MTSFRFKMLCASALLVLGVAARADVWEDCTAWYMGGKGSVGAFTDGDMTDLRHAALTNSPTHGGTLKANTLGTSNLLETVYSAASGVTFKNQRTIYMAQREIFDKNGINKVYANGIALPFAATNENYTLLMRVRLDEHQPTNKNWVTIADLGYHGSSPNYAFAVRYYPVLESLGLLYHGGNDKPIYTSPTNASCTTLRNTWLELSITLKKTTTTKSEMRIGVAAEGLNRVYEASEYAFKTSSVPYNGIIYLGDVNRYTTASATIAPPRGSYQMIAYWERVLTDDEILAAFKMEGFTAAYKSTTSLVKVGDPAYGAEMLGGAAVDEVTTASADLQDIGQFPGAITCGKTVKMPFSVIAECTNLPQIVRLTGSASSTGTFDVMIDTVPVGTVALTGGKTGTLFAPANLFTAGEHTLALTRTDAGEAAFRLVSVDVSGSWRLGWLDNNHAEMGGDLGSSANTKSYAVTRLVGPTSSTNYWQAVRSSVSSGRILRLCADVAEEDARDRHFTFKTRPCSYPAQKYHLVVDVNGVRKFDRFISNESPYKDHRSDPVAIALPPGTLLAGENQFEIYTEKDPNYPNAETWLRLDYFALEAGKTPRGTMIHFR